MLSLFKMFIYLRLGLGCCVALSPGAASGGCYLIVVCGLPIAGLLPLQSAGLRVRGLQ